MTPSLQLPYITTHRWVNGVYEEELKWYVLYNTKLYGPFYAEQRARGYYRTLDVVCSGRERLAE